MSPKTAHHQDLLKSSPNKQEWLGE